MKPSRGLRSVLAGAVMLTPVAVGSTSGCVDLFHSTDFVTLCDLDASAPGCGDAAASRDARDDARTTPMHDATVDHATGSDGRADDVSHADAPARREAGGHEAGDDAAETAAPPTNFCTWSSQAVVSHAEHACAWLAACAGNNGQNEYGTCYELAMLAYSCTANPNQQVRGRVHEYWDKLWQASSCADVMAAIFAPGAVPTCQSATGTTCGDSIGAPDIVVSCPGAGMPPGAAQFCPAQGFTCTGGACFLKDFYDCSRDAAAWPAPSCEAGVLHACRVIPDAAQPLDIGKDCTNFGAGRCVVDNDAGIAGCAPNDAGTSCTPSIHASCVDSGGQPVAVGCATGSLETVDCTKLGVPSTDNFCIVDASASNSNVSGACYTAAQNGGYVAPVCTDGGVGFTAYAGPSGGVTVASCREAGLGSCETNSASYPSCTAP